MCTYCLNVFFSIQKYQCIQEYGRNMPRLMKCRKNKRMQRDGYFSKKRCPCGRKKNKINPDEKLSQTEFLMKHASKGKYKCWVFLISTKRFYMNCTQKIFIDIFSPWKNKCLLNEFFFFFFADFSPKFIRTKRSYLQLVGNTSSSSQNSISSLSGMNHNDMQLDNQYLEKRW